MRMPQLLNEENKRAWKSLPKAIGIVAGALASIPYLYVRNKLFGGKRTTSLRDHFIMAASKTMNIKLVYNEHSAPVTNKVAIFPIKHLARMDARVIPEFPQADFMMTAHFFNMPVLGRVIKAAANVSGFIPTTQTSDDKKRDQGQVIQRLNDNVSVCVFPEGCCSGAEMLEWSKGSLEPLFGAAGEDTRGNTISLKNQDVVVQPVSLRVKEINGVDVLNSPDEWGKYTMILDHRYILSRVWARMKQQSVTVEMQVLPELNPRDFSSAEDLMNEAHNKVRQIVNPDQVGTRRRREFVEWTEAQPHRVY